MRKHLLNLLLVLASLLSQYVYAKSTSSAFESLFVKGHLLSPASAYYNFSGTPGGSIDYFQSCFATDNTCSTCTLPLLSTTYSNALPYGGYSISATALANLLQQTQVGAGTYYVKLAVQSAGFDCSSGTAYCQGNQDSNAQNLCLTTTYNGTSVTLLTQNDNGQVSLTSNPMTQYMYIVDTVQRNSLLSCPLSATGVASTCTLTPGGTIHKFGTPQSSAITTIDGTQYIYTAGQGYIDGGGLTPSAITQCTLGSGGGMSNCIQVTNTDYSWITNPGRIIITTVGNTQYAYTTDVTNNNITQCTLDSASVFGSCQNAAPGHSFGGTPLGMTFVVTNGQLYAYVAASAGINQGVEQCSVGNDGLLSSCTVTGTDAFGSSISWSPYDIKVAYSSDPTNPTRYAYVADHDNGILYKCNINTTTGGLENCAATPNISAPSWQPLQISFGVAQSGSNAQLYAYIADDSGLSSLWRCAMQTTGELASCSQMNIAGYTVDFFAGTAIGYMAP